MRPRLDKSDFEVIARALDFYIAHLESRLEEEEGNENVEEITHAFD